MAAFPADRSSLDGCWQMVEKRPWRRGRVLGRSKTGGGAINRWPFTCQRKPATCVTQRKPATCVTPVNFAKNTTNQPPSLATWSYRERQLRMGSVMVALWWIRALYRDVVNCCALSLAIGRQLNDSTLMLQQPATAHGSNQTIAPKYGQLWQMRTLSWRCGTFESEVGNINQRAHVQFEQGNSH